MATVPPEDISSDLQIGSQFSQQDERELDRDNVEHENAESIEAFLERSRLQSARQIEGISVITIDLAPGEHWNDCPPSPDATESEADSEWRMERDGTLKHYPAVQHGHRANAVNWLTNAQVDIANFDSIQTLDKGLTTCADILKLGFMRERIAAEQTDEVSKSRQLQQALAQYRKGSDLMEACYRAFDDPRFPVSAFDHNVCSNLFISAARLCLAFENMSSPPPVRQLFPDPQAAQGWKEQALQFLEQGRARSLQYMIENGPVSVPNGPGDVFDGIKTAIQEELQSMIGPRANTPALAHVVQYAIKRGKVKQQASGTELSCSSSWKWAAAINRVMDDRRNQMMLSRFPIVRAALEAPRTSKQLIANIPADTVVIEFGQASEKPQGLMVLVITSKKIEVASWLPCNIQELDAFITNAALAMWDDKQGRKIREVTTEEGMQALDKLSDLLRHSSILDVLNSKKRVVFITSGNLAHVPWAMLPLDRPLVNTHSVTVAPSLSIWNLLRDRDYSTHGGYKELAISVVSNSPYHKSGMLRNIHWSRVEALHIARLHSEWPVLADDLKISEFEEKIKSVDILHLCAHGDFDSEFPMASKIHLCEESLSVADLSKMELEAKLVVFSSCFSALSKGHDSGSAFGFSYALLGSGAQCFVGTLWPVDDASTMLFMLLFYDLLRAGGSPADSLRGAQNGMQKLDHGSLALLLDKLGPLAGIQIEQCKRYIHNPFNRLVVEVPKLVENLDKFQQPRAWAGFVLIGYGEISIYRTNRPPVGMKRKSADEELPTLKKRLA